MLFCKVLNLRILLLKFPIVIFDKFYITAAERPFKAQSDCIELDYDVVPSGFGTSYQKPAYMI